MRHVIFGAGVVGYSLATMLSKEGHDITIIEKSTEKIEYIMGRLDCKVISDDGSNSLEVMRQARVQDSDFYIASSDSDERNMIACLLAKQLSSKIKCIARIQSLDYVKDEKTLQKAFGIDYFVHPERETALSIIRSIEYGGVTDVYLLNDFDVVMRSYIVHEKSPLVGKTVSETQRLVDSDFLISLINNRGGDIIVPSGNTVLQELDEVYFIGNEEAFEKLFQAIGEQIRVPYNIVVFGAGNISRQIVSVYKEDRSGLSHVLGRRVRMKKEITVIEKDRNLCVQFADDFSDVTVLHADITEERMLEEVDVYGKDMVIAATERQGDNIVLAAHCKKAGVPRAVSVVSNSQYIDIAAELGIDLAFSVWDSVINSIIGYLKGEKTFYSISEGNFDVFKVQVATGCFAHKKTVEELNFPENSLVLLIAGDSSSQDAVVPHGSTRFSLLDNVLIISAKEHVEKIRSMFGKK